MSIPTPTPTTCKYSLSERLVCLCKCRPHVHRCRQQPAGDTGSCELPYMVTAHQRRTQGRMGLCVEFVCKEKKSAKEEILGRAAGTPHCYHSRQRTTGFSRDCGGVMSGPEWSYFPLTATCF